jgi:hypothetical protein
MNGWHAGAGHGSTVALTGRPGGGRVLAHFAIDLIASLAAVLALGWFFEASVSSAHLQDAVVTQNAIYAAISKFTPRNLLFSYFATVDRLTINAAYTYQFATGFTGTIHEALLTVGKLVVSIFLAIPYTLLELYDQTSGTAARIVLAVFGMVLGSVFAVLFMTRMSMLRLILAAIISPVAISILFLALQGFMTAMLDTFYWFTSLAPYTVACPILCSVYWIVFPNAERGATAGLAHAMLRVLESNR